MKNDLTQFEKDLLKSINMTNNTRYNYKNLMEWNTNKSIVENNIKENEKLYTAFGVWVAIRPETK